MTGWWTVVGRRSIAGWQPISVQRRRHITGRWQTIVGAWAIRQWLITGWWLTVVGRWLIIGRQRGHALGSSKIRRCARGEQRRRDGGRNARVAHDILCSMSPAKLNTEVGRVFPHSKPGHDADGRFRDFL